MFLTGVILCIPLVFWMYVFITFFPNPLARVFFLVWIFIWGLTSLPLVFHEKLFFWNILEDIFMSLSELLFSSFFLSFSLYFFFLLSCVAILTLFFQKSKKIFLKNIVIVALSFLFFIFLLWGIYFSLAPYFSSFPSNAQVLFGDIVFTSFIGIFWYYLCIALLEEGWKFLWNLAFSWDSHTFWNFHIYMVLSASLALGFSFFENILYLSFFVQKFSWGTEVLSLAFFRSIFVMILHLFSSLLFALGMWYLFILIQKKEKIFSLFWAFLFFSTLWYLSHIFFDIGMTFGYMWIAFIYVFFLYVYMSYIFTMRNFE